MKWRHDKVVTSNRLVVIEQVTMRELTLECGHVVHIAPAKGIPSVVDCGICRQVERERENKDYQGA